MLLQKELNTALDHKLRVTFSGVNAWLQEDDLFFIAALVWVSKQPTLFIVFIFFCLYRFIGIFIHLVAKSTISELWKSLLKTLFALRLAVNVDSNIVFLDITGNR